MMASSHSAMGVAAAALIATVSDLPPADTVTLAAIMAVGALVPDLDHPSAKLTRGLWPAGPLAAWLIGLFGGGHRGVTHSLSGLAVAGVTMPLAAAGLAWPAWWGTALAAGCAVHVLGDLMTETGVPLFWPHPRRYRIASLDTGKWVEALLVVPVCAIITGLTTYDHLIGGIQ